MKKTLSATAMVAKLGYTKVSELIKEAHDQNRSIREFAINNGDVTTEEFEHLTNPEAVMRLESP